MRLNARRLALGTFVAVQVSSFVLSLWVGRFAWFSQDEWDFLADRSAGSLHDLFRPKNEHWTTLPVLAFRCFWWLFGVRTYVPYLVLVVFLHLAVAALLRAVMIRARVGPVLATAAGSAFALFGTGYFNIEYAFQITFVGSLAFGLGQLLLTDHSGPVDRRDWLGVLAGLAGLACSGVGLAMAGVVGVAVLVRRGWRAALFNTTPLGAAYVVWLVSIGQEGSGGAPGANFQQTMDFVTREIGATFGSLGQLPGVGLLLGAMLVVGLVVAWASLPGPTFRERAAAPAALLVGAVAFLLITAISRGAPFATSTPPGPASRYRYVVAAMILPAVAVAADAMSRRWRPFAPIAFALIIVGIPGNVQVLIDNAPDWREYKQLILSAPRLPISPSLPGSVRPDSFGAPWLTIGWLRDGVASGRIPAPAKLTPRYVASRTLDLALQPAPRAAVGPCVTLEHSVIRVLRTGTALTLRSGATSIAYEPLGAIGSVPRPLPAGTMVAVAGPLRLRLTPALGGRAPVVCG